ncbi:MAG: ABC transporter substrate-binding protein [Clostridia bacterium]|nr:ABC transporter substrate-binding protein [Clostridia bacterium]
MKKTKKLVSFLMTAAIAATCLSGCGEQKEQTAEESTGTASASAIKIGGIGPVTGAAAIYGQAVKNAAEIAVEEINALGGLQFELKFEDDENDAEKAINAYNKLKDWGMQVSLGTVTTQPCIALSTEVNADRFFALTPSASSTDVLGGQPDKDGNVTIERKDNMFQMCFTDPNQGIASAQYIKDQNLGEKIAVIYNNSDAYSTGIYQKFQSEADKLGLNIVAVKTFTDDSANDFTSQLNEIKSAEADLIFLPIYYTPASLILSQANKMMYAPKFFGVDGMDGILTLDNFDTSLAEGVMLLTPFTADADDELTKNFVAKYQEKFNEIPNQFAADSYDCVYAIYEACKAKNITADMSHEDICEALIEQFTSPDFKIDGLTGTGMTWSESGEVSKAPKGMVIKDGVYVGM